MVKVYDHNRSAPLTDLKKHTFIGQNEFLLTHLMTNKDMIVSFPIYNGNKE